MKVVHLCKSTDNGGFIAAWRLHQALVAAGIDSRMVVRERNGNDAPGLVAFDDSRMWWFWFRVRGALSRFLHRILLGKGAIREFYLQWIPTFIPQAVRRRLAPDILHVHAADDGLWSLWELSKWPDPIVWTFHAYRDFSQGYIYLAHRLDEWVEAGRQGSLHDRDKRLVAGMNLSLKKKLMSGRKDICIAPSAHVHRAGRISGVFDGSQHQVVRNCVPLDYFRAIGREEWRVARGIEESAFVVLAGAHSLEYLIKGFDLLVAAILGDAEEFRSASVTVVLFGGGRVPDELQAAVRVIELGYLDEEGLRAAYSGADLLVIPSREDNFPNVIVEALACGLPYVGFDAGGVGEMAAEDHMVGETVPAYDTARLAKAILDRAVGSLEKRLQSREAARAVAEANCDPVKVAAQHISLYESLLARRSTPSS
ncbi:glycosyltransferase [Luteolibacter sp. LG18]|uniref:glycosyltransferase n=1 Tax=Luteolibacter sp. LG18 TaxID=2819286 RepID=UPI002B2A7346|nr:glycosyl transferase [Luteolibacter sp. LG18]